MSFGPTRSVDPVKAESELALNVKKALSPDETAPKQKHVRSASTAWAARGAGAGASSPPAWAPARGSVRRGEAGDRPEPPPPSGDPHLPRNVRPTCGPAPKREGGGTLAWRNRPGVTRHVARRVPWK
ncbi:MAG: hypothetical protein BJ554DRAFT_3513 [Olpidium bornovanus]|uniref:Uncharacterized protein n=1 Tax=Olpidium bornovanus TaxID=278681 RepID=A0A8H7ZP36_9FUNG|nr:MAG: hypothetical protein BJ554DRAFT_3513 [Olpidium bornovanus]